MKHTWKITFGAAALLLLEIALCLPLFSGGSALAAIRTLWLSGGVISHSLAAVLAVLPPVLALVLLIRLLLVQRRLRKEAANAPKTEVRAAAPASATKPADSANISTTIFGCVRFLSGPREGDLVPIPADVSIQLGRNPQACQVVLNEPDVSRTHLTVCYHAARKTFLLTDHSANGTYWADGRQLPKNLSVEVPDGSIFYLGGQKSAIQLLSYTEATS